VGHIIYSDRDGPARLPQEMVDAKREARRTLEDAERVARKIVEDAAGQAEALCAQARAAGREQGRAEAAALLVKAQLIYDGTLTRAEGEIVQIAIAAAERIIGNMLEKEPATIARIVSPVLARARSARQITVRVHPEDVGALAKVASRLAAQSDLSGSFEIEPDDSLARGGCIVCTDGGTLEATIEVQLASLARALTA
jgi:type III secretion protein L